MATNMEIVWQIAFLAVVIYHLYEKRRAPAPIAVLSDANPINGRSEREDVLAGKVEDNQRVSKLAEVSPASAQWSVRPTG
jgi:hypothetical protein